MMATRRGRDGGGGPDLEVARSTRRTPPGADDASPGARAERAFARGDHLDAAGRWLEQADRARHAGDEPVASEVEGCAGLALHLAGRHERAVPLLEQAVASWVRLQDRDVHAALVGSLCELGRTDEAWAALPCEEEARREDLGFPELRAVLLRGWPGHFTPHGGAFRTLASALRSLSATISADVVDGHVVWVRQRGSRWTLAPTTATAAGPVVPWGGWQLRNAAAGLGRSVDTYRLLRWTDLAIAADAAVGDLRAAYDQRGPLAPVSAATRVGATAVDR